MKATRCMVCTRTQEWEDFSVPVHFCDTYVWVWECGCLFFLTHPHHHLSFCVAACVCESISGCVCLPVCIIWRVFEVFLQSLHGLQCAQCKHTHTHTQASCVVRLLTVSSLRFIFRLGLSLTRTCPVHRKMTVPSLSLSHSLSFPLHSPSLIFSRALSHSFTLSFSLK